MNNTISLIMLGGVLAVCCFFVVKGFQVGKNEKDSNDWVVWILVGALAGLLFGFFLGPPIIETIVSESWLQQDEKRGLGLWCLGTLITTVSGALIGVCLFQILKKKENLKLNGEIVN